MKTINELRKALKPLGYNVKTKSLSWGRHATYTHIATKQECSANVFTPDQYALWKPLFDWRKENNAELKELRELTDTRGLV